MFAPAPRPACAARIVSPPTAATTAFTASVAALSLTHTAAHSRPSRSAFVPSISANPVRRRARAAPAPLVKAHPLAPTLLPATLLPAPRAAPAQRRPTAPTMGIKGLTKLLGDNAASAIRPQEPVRLAGRKLAIDASMCIYQLLVAVRTGVDNLTNDAGTVTSHLNGLFYRTIRLLELGIKPAYVFDGAPPSMKAGELAKRAEAKAAAEAAAKAAVEAGDLDAAEKHARRVNRVTPEMTADCQTLLRLMGIPVVSAPCEAEAQCAELAKAGLVYAAASEDMDSLTFGTPVLVRHLWAGTAATAAKKGVKPTEFVLDAALAELGLSMDEFIDLCILCGCDYLDGIRGVGVVKALNLIKKHKSLDKVMEAIRGEKGFIVPEEYPFEQAREMFVKPDVTPAAEISLKWGKPDIEGLKKFMVEDNQFDEVKIDTGIKRLLASKKATNQVRVDSFFTKKPSAAKPKSAASAAKGTTKTTPSKTGKGKRVAAPAKGNAAKKAKTK